jgi:epoxyqueuosine reductase
MSETKTEETVQRIKTRARSLGFLHVGIAPVEPAPAERDHLKLWLDRGYQATMGWMERTAEKRMDCRKVLEGAQSVIVTACNYYHPLSHSEEPGVGKISRYAWGDDYHKIVLQKLEALSGWLQEQFPGCKALPYVDTGPVMEKALASQAGIGWLGKHSNVITQEHGSWLFLGEILTTLPLPPDQPAVDHCGSCTLCIEACPTQAIVEPYVVDAGKCISYLTIEHRGPFDGTVHGRFENWIFGCDICQDVCPWNRKFATDTDDARFAPHPGNAAPDLAAWARMGREEFNARFAASPVRRARWEGLLRNVRFVLEQGRRPEASA